MAAVGQVKVAVRVRPFNQREIDRKAKLVIQMKKNQTWLYQKPGDDATVKKFTFDHSYWSHGVDDSHYANQEQVFNDLGKDVITAAFDGFNACLFAYGQTGSGKSYSMMGYGEAVGMIPRICEGIFEKVAQSPDDTEYSCEVSYLEIYNEKVKDLLVRVDAKSKPKQLKVRENPKTGPYVEGLSVHNVSDYEQIQALMDLGNENRTTAATAMNDTSSRSHSVFTIKFNQASFVAGVPAEKAAKLNLVDLAGSERQQSTGATGARLQEGSNINKSLTTLGLVISALADASIAEAKGKKKKKKGGSGAFIPYRNSVLTWLLRESLGGNSKTIMVAAVSPADINYGETLSTLHYANRAKNIVNKPIVNEDENVRLIRELRAEVDRLKKLLGGDEEITRLQGEADAAKARLAAATTDEERAQIQEEIDSAETLLGQAKSADKEMIQAQLQQSEKMMDVLTGQWKSKWETQTKILEDRALQLNESGRALHVESEQPHLVSLNIDDPLATGVILYYLNPGLTHIGLEGGDPAPDIALRGQGIELNHCVIDYDGEETITLTPKEGAQIALNGREVTAMVEMHQGTTLTLGQNNIFRFNNPAEAAKMRAARDSKTVTPGSSPPSYSPGLVLHDQQKEEQARIQQAQDRLRELEEKNREHEESRAKAEAEMEAARAVEVEKQQQMAEELQRLKDIMSARDAEVEALKTQTEELSAHATEAERLAREREEAMEQRRQAEEEASRLAELAEREKQEFQEKQRQIEAEKEREAQELRRQLEEQQAAAFEVERQKRMEEQQKMEEELRQAEERARMAAEQAAEAEAQQKKAEGLAQLAEEQRQKDLQEKEEQLKAERELGAEARAKMQGFASESEMLRKQKSAAELSAAERQKLLEEEQLRRKQIEDMQQKSKAEKELRFDELWDIAIPKVHTRGDSSSGSSYVVYEIRIVLQGESWKIFRRYREFYQFHSKMKSLMPGIVNYIKFPGKKLWPDAAFLKKRREALEIYLNELIAKSYLLPQSPFYKTDRGRLMRTVPFFRPGEALR